MVLALLLMAASALGQGPYAARVVGDLKVEMSVAQAAFKPGTPIAVTMRVRNTAAGPLTLAAREPQYDLIVRQRGALIWQWSSDKAYVQEVRTVQMAPAEVRTFRISWDQQDLQGRPVDAGTYEISCVFTGGPAPRPAAIEVGPVRIVIAR